MKIIPAFAVFLTLILATIKAFGLMTVIGTVQLTWLVVFAPVLIYIGLAVSVIVGWLLILLVLALIAALFGSRTRTSVSLLRR
ncbi:hypothetical protein [Xanthomonas phage SB3]|uniref:Uncharacterized protein n=1 Tax=Xanthomonas phage SB3 TaxID=3117472 RepID=A0ABZ2GVL6_9CAUD